MKKTLFYRNLLPIVCLLIFSFIIFGSVFASWSYRYILNQQRGDMLRTSSNAVHTVSSLTPRYALDSLDMRMSISILASISNYDIMVADTQGTVVACSDGLHCEHLGKMIPSPSVGPGAGGKGPEGGRNTLSSACRELTTILRGLYLALGRVLRYKICYPVTHIRH